MILFAPELGVLLFIAGVVMLYLTVKGVKVILAKEKTMKKLVVVSILALIAISLGWSLIF